MEEIDTRIALLQKAIENGYSKFEELSKLTDKDIAHIESVIPKLIEERAGFHRRNLYLDEHDIKKLFNSDMNFYKIEKYFKDDRNKVYGSGVRCYLLSKEHNPGSISSSYFRNKTHSEVELVDNYEYLEISWDFPRDSDIPF